MRIAIVGTGISGLTAAHYLRQCHDLTLYEAGQHIGGHTHTVDVEFEGEAATIDTGFIVFNDWTYPNFIRLIDELGVGWQDTTMSFSVRCDRSGWEYNGGSLSGLFVQKLNLARPAFWRMLLDVMRFNREAPGLLDRVDDDETVGDYLSRKRYSKTFADRYLIPMGAAIWSCPPGVFSQFPIRFIVEFYRNHGLLSVTRRPTWRVIRGGSREYVRALIKPLADRILTQSPIRAVRRYPDRVEVESRTHGVRVFDHVIFACHSDQALNALSDPTAAELEILREFPYQENSVVLHTDVSVLPRRKGAWAAWNYHIRDSGAEHATLTYNMNLLQGLRKTSTYCVTLNCDELIEPSRVLGRFTYHHPIYTTRRGSAQRRHSELINQRRTSYCGAYWGNGFHEDGVNSALAVCRTLDPNSTPCTVASTKAPFNTAEPAPSAMNSAIDCS
ncbi:MAG: FAD-dependent oxidoreductase [Planctomycetaceae bacterium]|nr:MAG: FAD-dependent oxidoreductase [Planctomycetaceae bacterium]